MPIRSSHPAPAPGARPEPLRSRKANSLARAFLVWFGRDPRDLPWRRTRDPYAIWVSEIMLQQTQVKTVIPYWERWMKALPTIRHLARARPERVLKLWEGLGYYRRARHLQEAARLILVRHAGQFPGDFPSILELPGIGRYTAGAICSIAFNHPTPILDGNVTRVLTRLGGVEQDPRERAVQRQLWDWAETLVRAAAALEAASQITTRPSGQACSHLNQAMMEFGALVCLPQRPRCGECPIRRLCRAWRTGRVDDIPNLAAGPAAVVQRVLAVVLKSGDSYLARRRADGGVNGGLWEFPNLEIVEGEEPAVENWLAPWGVRWEDLAPLATVRHAITRYRITLEARTGQWKGRSRSWDRSDRWLRLAEMERLPWARAHRRVLDQLCCSRMRSMVLSSKAT